MPESEPRIAPRGKVWMCQMCGKVSRDLYGDKNSSRGWDASCVMNAILCDEAIVNETKVD